MNTVSRRLRFAVACIAASLVVPTAAWAQQDKTAERNARRMQLQLQAAQQQLQEAQAARAKAEAERADVEKRLGGQTQELSRVQTAQRKAATSAKAMESARAELEATAAGLQKRVADQQRASDEAIAAKDREIARLTKTGEADRMQLQARHDEQSKLVGECTDKNQRLVRLNAELLDRYRRKGVVDALKQRDPLLGLSEVQMFNLVQDFRDKAEAERFVPGGAK